MGIGGASRYNGPAEMKQYVDTVIKPLMLGQNPFDVETLTGGISSSGARGLGPRVDTALWDIIGKAKGVPCTSCSPWITEPVTRIRTLRQWRRVHLAQELAFPGPRRPHPPGHEHQRNGYTAFKFRHGGGFGRLGITIKDYIPYLRRIRDAGGAQVRPDPGNRTRGGVWRSAWKSPRFWRN